LVEGEFGDRAAVDVLQATKRIELARHAIADAVKKGLLTEFGCQAANPAYESLVLRTPAKTNMVKPFQRLSPASQRPKTPMRWFRIIFKAELSSAFIYREPLIGQWRTHRSLNSVQSPITHPQIQINPRPDDQLPWQTTTPIPSMI
jgi:hypothetical protein